VEAGHAEAVGEEHRVAEGKVRRVLQEALRLLVFLGLPDGAAGLHDAAVDHPHVVRCRCKEEVGRGDAEVRAGDGEGLDGDGKHEGVVRDHGDDGGVRGDVRGAGRDGALGPRGETVAARGKGERGGGGVGGEGGNEVVDNRHTRARARMRSPAQLPHLSMAPSYMEEETSS
jgi:hypothetical protein